MINCRGTVHGTIYPLQRCNVDTAHVLIARARGIWGFVGRPHNFGVDSGTHYLGGCSNGQESVLELIGPGSEKRGMEICRSDQGFRSAISGLHLGILEALLRSVSNVSKITVQ